MFSKKRVSEWCCLGFEAGYGNAGNRGHTYLIGRDSLEKPEFIIQFRSVESGNEEKVSSECPLSVVSELRINFCPTCGTELSKFYGDRLGTLYRPGLEIGLLKKLNHGDILVAGSTFPDPS